MAAGLPSEAGQATRPSCGQRCWQPGAAGFPSTKANNPRGIFSGVTQSTAIACTFLHVR